MNIFVYDTAAGRTKDWPKLLGRPFEYVNLTLTDKKASCIVPKGVQADLTSSLILLHGPRNRKDAAVVIAATLTQEYRACSAVVVSGGGLTEDAQLERVYLRRTPVDKEDVGFRGCFEAFISDLEKSQGKTPRFGLLEPDKPAPLALRLLCEAWQIVNVERKAKCSEIPIHAPSILPEWLEPFGTAATAGEVAGLMGESATAATDLLNAVERPNENNVKDAVTAFLSASGSKK